MAFLPPASHASGPAIELAEPPVIQPNLYLKDVPPFLLTNPQFSERRAARGFARRGAPIGGLRPVSGTTRATISGTPAGNSTPPSTRCWTPRTRIPADREEYERKLDEMVDAIHRLDLAGLGASAGIEEGQFEKAPLEDILQMTFPVDPRLKDKVREQVAATVSQLPLAVNDAVLGYIHYFSGPRPQDAGWRACSARAATGP